MDDEIPVRNEFEGFNDNPTTYYDNDDNDLISPPARNMLSNPGSFVS
jgi:hypothetical protein